MLLAGLTGSLPPTGLILSSAYAAEAVSPAAFTSLTNQLHELLENKQYGELLTESERYFAQSLTPEQQAKLTLIELKALIKYKDKQGAEVAAAIANTKSRLDKLLVNLNQPTLQAELAYQQSQLAFYKGDYEQAEQYNQQALSFINGEETELASNAYYFLGASQARQGNFTEAVESMLTGLKITEDLGQPYSLRQLLGMGAMYNLLGDMQSAVKWTEKALDIATPGSSQMMTVKNNLASSLVESGRIEEGIVHMRDSIQIAETLGLNNFSAINNLGYTYMLVEKYDEALTYLNRAREYYQQNQIMPLQAMTLKNIGEVYSHKGDYQQAADYFAQSLAIYREHESVKPHLELYPVMIDNLTKLEQYKQALVLMQEYKALADETNSLESQKHINELTTRFEVELKEKELERLSLEQILHQESIAALENEQRIDQKINLMMDIIVASLTVTLGILLVLLRYRSRAHTKLKTKNEDITALNKQLTELARIDTLTGLYNRRYLTDFVNAETKRLMRKSPDTQAGEWLLIALDIDHFKQFNDKYGHAAGDIALVNFARQLQESARDSDFVIRWGGEEFLWLCKGMTLNDANSLYHRLTQRLSQHPLDMNGEFLPITCSAGMVHFPLTLADDQAWQVTIELADRALYKAKELGRAQWVGYVANQATPDSITLESLTELISSGAITEIQGKQQTV
ncbi:hypothetical protein BFC17_14670 [Alteromonas lipolytica]|uniref:diguanylate cyclase n=2 Tax=Alteromonas lipolytica TaxID=1856405 RepID=A0A1E8FFU7_9ALTE|nr:hypothetical protein BFC17_14670 [Alteromonas lipolytica]